MKKGTTNKTNKTNKTTKTTKTATTATTAKKPEASKEQPLEEIVVTLMTQEYNKLDQMHRVLCEILDLLKENRGHFEYRVPHWTETPAPRLNDPDYAPGRTAPSWPPRRAPGYPTDPWGSPVPYCGHGTDRIYCGLGQEHCETASSAEDGPRRFNGYRK